ncbi:hypothetical protein [Halomarina litorea]|nr:hypothetical protein [Halomarina sp. BCD28]
MTLTCPDCGTVDVELVGSNGAEYPETRVERYECCECGRSFTKTLTA